jgi:hypothetical protein
VSATSRVQLGWDAPATKLYRFKQKVESEWGGTSPYVGIQIEQSWREFRRSDEQHELEAIADDILEATGRSPDRNEKKIFGQSFSSETDKVWNRVHEEVKEEMSAYAAECNVPKHVVLEGVIDWYLDGGRVQKVIDKLDAVVDDIKDTFAVVSGDATAKSKSERITIAIANRLGPGFHEEDLGEAIHAETSGTDYYHEEYTGRVIDYKGVRRLKKPDSPDIFLPESTWKAKKTGEIIDNLGGNPEKNTAPTFTDHELADAAGHAGIEVDPDNPEMFREYQDRVLDRLGFVWDDELEQFIPRDDAETELGPDESVDDARTVDGSVSVRDDVESRLDEISEAPVADGGNHVDDRHLDD